MLLPISSPHHRMMHIREIFQLHSEYLKITYRKGNAFIFLNKYEKIHL